MRTGIWIIIVLVLIIGVAFWAYSKNEAREETKDLGQQTGDLIEDSSRKAKTMAEDAAESMKDTAEKMRDAVKQ